MRLVEVVCPSCGAHVLVDIDDDLGCCRRCGASLVAGDGDAGSPQVALMVPAGSDSGEPDQLAVAEAQRLRLEGRLSTQTRVDEGRWREDEETAIQAARIDDGERDRSLRRHWLWAWLWWLLTPVPLVYVVGWVFSMLPGNPSVHSFAGWFVWYVLITLPVLVECCLELRRRQFLRTWVRRVFTVLLVFVYVVALSQIARVSADYQQGYFQRRDAAELADATSHISLEVLP